MLRSRSSTSTTQSATCRKCRARRSGHVSRQACAPSCSGGRPCGAQGIAVLVSRQALRETVRQCWTPSRLPGCSPTTGAH
eukprot:4986907-Alexandrium_andersonii.AAC.1